MHDEKLKKTLESAFPETPALFHHRLLESAEECRKPKARRVMRPALRLALCCLAALLLCGGAIAAMTHYGVLNFDSGWDDAYYFTLPQAQSMIQYGLAEETTGHLRWQVKEAVYDGRILSILYAVRDLDASRPVSADEQYAAADEMRLREGVYLQCDGNGEIFVNGKGVNLNAVSCRPGTEPGEVEFWVDCRMEYYDEDAGEYLRIAPEGTLTIALPFEYLREKADGEPDALHFQLQAGDAATRYSLSLPAPYTLPSGAVLTFTDLHFSPAAVFMDFQIAVPPSQAQAMAGVSKDDYEAYEAALASCVPEYRLCWNAQLKNSRGEALGISKDGFWQDSLQPDGSLLLAYHQEFTPSDHYTDVIYLCLGDDIRVPIPMKYLSDSP